MSRHRASWLALLVLASALTGCASEDGGGPETAPTRPSDDATGGPVGNEGDASDEGGEQPADGGAGPDSTPADDNATNETGGDEVRAGPPADLSLALKEVVGGLEQPVHLEPANDGSGRLFIVEQKGLVRVLDAQGRLLDEPFLNRRGHVSTGGEQGLLSIAFPPQPDGRVYVSYTDNDGTSVLSRYQIAQDDPPRVDPDSEEELLRVAQPFGNHNGGLILFGPDGYLWYGLGDGGSGGDPLGNGQDPGTLLGSLLRLDVSGESGYSIPPDNPFVGGEGRDEIVHYGLRNPWRFSFDRETNDLYVADVGQNEVEEVNHVPAGALGLNFGWNVWEGSERYRSGSTRGEATFPVAEYTHSDTGGCSVTGGHVYRGGNISGLHGVYLYADYCSGDVWGLWKDAEGAWQTRRLLQTELSITAFGEDHAGELYVVHHGGAVHRLVEA